MRVRDVIFYEETFGITQKSLKSLRDTLARSIDHRICVVEIITNELLCGFLIFDRDTGIVTFTGDGFRTDGGGEGGAGYRSAQALFDLFGIGLRVIPWHEVVPVSEAWDPDDRRRNATRKKLLLSVVKHIAKTLSETDFIIPSKKTPLYVR